MENLLNQDKFYYHPFTRVPRRPPIVDVLPTGELIDDNTDEFSIAFKHALYPKDVVEYFYKEVSIPKELQNLKRDMGAVKYMTDRNGIDIVMFAIDCLIDDYYDSQHRSGYYPSVLDADHFLQEADVRLGIAKQIARQYQIDESAVKRNA